MKEEIAALITDPTPASRAELQNIVSTALHGAHVNLADDALTESSTLVIERQPRRDPLGNRLPGRTLETPERFHLLLSGGKCVLVHHNSEQRWELREASCRAAD
ncbi:MAG: hypothetical protein WDZ30_03205 [Cellvibrionaceae bacterium]